MKCSKCGKEIANDSNFCEFCGERITSSKQQFLKSHRKVFYAICALSIIIGFGLIVLIVNSAMNNRVIDTTETPSDNIAVVDLGLPSGTLWRSDNEEGLYDYDSAVSIYGESLPTKEQWEELENQCQWSWTGSGYEVTGPNGNTIFLPAAGGRNSRNGDVYDVGHWGLYWSSTPCASETAWSLNFLSTGEGVGGIFCGIEQSVRLVHN